MIQKMFTCDRCNRKKELKGNTKEDSKEVYNVIVYHHGDRILYTKPQITKQLCRECEIELEKWMEGENDVEKVFEKVR